MEKNDTLSDSCTCEFTKLHYKYVFHDMNLWQANNHKNQDKEKKETK